MLLLSFYIELNLSKVSDQKEWERFGKRREKGVGYKSYKKPKIIKNNRGRNKYLSTKGQKNGSSVLIIF